MTDSQARPWRGGEGVIAPHGRIGLPGNQPFPSGPPFVFRQWGAL